MISQAVNHSFVAEQPASARNQVSCSLAHLSSWPAFTSMQERPRFILLEASFSLASLNFLDSLCLKEACSRDRSSVADRLRMNPVDTSAKIGNFPRSISMSACPPELWPCIEAESEVNLCWRSPLALWVPLLWRLGRRGRPGHAKSPRRVGEKRFPGVHSAAPGVKV
jgi:hypothetical protein